MSHKMKVSDKLMGELHLPNMMYPLVPSQTITLEDDAFNSADIQLAIANGFLVCEDKQTTKTVTKTPTCKKNKENVIQDIKQPKQTIPEENEEPKTCMGAWDPHKKTILDKDQSSKQTMQDLNATQAGVQVGNIDFSDKPDAQTIKQVTKKTRVKKTTRKTSKNKALAQAAKDVAKVVANERKNIKPVGTKKVASSDLGEDFVYANETNDVSFVDQEQERERIAQNPKLKAKLNEEVE